MSPLLSDTTYNKDCRSSSWEAMYQFFENEKPRVIIKFSTTCLSVPSDHTYFNVACSFIHKVAARPKILPYIDMVKWVIDHLNIEDREFKNSKDENICSFMTEYVRTMYHLPTLQLNYEKDFFQRFIEKHPNLKKVIKEWKDDQGKLKWDKHGT